MSNVRRFLDLSTTHLRPATREAFGQRLDLVSMTGPYGWLLHVPEEDGARASLAAFTELPAVFRVARTEDCDFVLFDADANADDRLELFDDEP